MPRAKKIDDAVTIKVGGVVADGQGGYYRAGTKVDGLSAENVSSLKAKGYI